MSAIRSRSVVALLVGLLFLQTGAIWPRRPAAAGYTPGAECPNTGSGRPTDDLQWCTKMEAAGETLDLVDNSTGSADSDCTAGGGCPIFDGTEVCHGPRFDQCHGDNGVFGNSTGSYCVSARWRSDQNLAGGQPMLRIVNSSGTIVGTFQRDSSSGNVKFNVNGVNCVSGTATPPANNWMHLEVQIDESGGTHTVDRIYINNVETNCTDTAFATTPDRPYTLCTGTNCDHYADDLFIYGGTEGGDCSFD